MSHSLPPQPSVSEPLDLAVVARYLSRESDVTERQRVDAWAHAAPDNARWLAHVQRLWSPDGAMRGSWDLEAMWRGVVGDHDAAGRRAVKTGRQESPAGQGAWKTGRGVGILTLRRSRGAVIASVAALVITLVAITTLDMFPGTRVSNKTKTYATTAGQQAIVTLPNGAQAILGPATTVRVEVAPDSGGAIVTVEGEAVFTVASRHRAPLVVQTRNAITRVLGTTFLVRQYATDPVARIVVTEGRISLSSTNVHTAASQRARAVLAPGTLGVVDDSGNVRVIPNVPAEDYLAWTTGTLVFHQTPVAEIVDELGRAYGVDLRLTDSMLRRRAFTWSVSVTKLTLADALDALTTALSAHVVQSGDVITIVPGPLSQKSNRPSPFSSSEKQYGR